LPSLYEGFPNVLLEAMICQVPVIATDAPGAMREILSPNSRGQKINNIFLGEYGVLIPPKDPKAISEAISLFLNDEELKEEYAKRAFERAKDFDVENIIKKWKEIL
jgi:N-acetylgalactosamine-N,N'-diacetylbacillosaminyl-diphospho-undecaprenol 4-alpha-N-acetylgalactosaminyltransferase